MRFHIGGMRPGADEDARTIRIPSPTIPGASGTSMITDIQVTLMTPPAAPAEMLL
jgi:hypothetical protein